MNVISFNKILRKLLSEFYFLPTHIVTAQKIQVIIMNTEPLTTCFGEGILNSPS